MTVTISRLYDDYASARQAMRDLEAAGVPHADISIVASNADNWYSDKKSASSGTILDREPVEVWLIDGKPAFLHKDGKPY